MRMKNYKISIGQVYKLTDSNPIAFAEIKKVSNHSVWDDGLEEDVETAIAWGDWYQQRGEYVCRHSNAGFETYRLALATQEEIKLYEEKVKQYQLEESK